jgi:hypothetical protein
VLAAVVALPSVLRPPPDQQQSSSALNPDAPPEESPEVLLQSLRQAASRTAGATGADDVTVTTLPPVQKPSRGTCFGDPPRQVESIYAAPCRAAFVGDNGGATYRNVTGDEVRVGFWHGLVNTPEGPVSETPPPDENAAARTMRVLQAYINHHFELYGRRFQLVSLSPTDTSAAGHKAMAVRADQELHVFASIYLAPPYCEEMARRGLPTICDNVSRSFYERNQPYVWSWLPDLTTTDRLTAELVCKQLKDRPAAYAGDAALQATTRKIGVAVQSDPAVNGERSASELASALRDQCGIEAEAIDFNAADDAGTGRLATAMSIFRSKGVTSVIVSAQGGLVLALMSTATANQYFPEWIVPGQYALDWNSFARLFPPEQSAHAFGVGPDEIARALNDTECFRAYRSEDPNGSPDRQTCLLFWQQLLTVANGIQEAGPTLTAESFRDGLYSIGERLYPGNAYASGGGFGPGDWTYLDSVGLFWWDNAATDPEQNGPGAYHWLHDGRRYVAGEIPAEEPQFFTDGITQPSEARRA